MPRGIKGSGQAAKPSVAPSKAHVAVCIPSRGLIHSRTIEEVIANLGGTSHSIYISHDQPIPDAYNNLVWQALSDDATSHVWIVEEDMKLPDDILVEMLSKDSDIVSVDYPVAPTFMVRSHQNDYDLGGTGCLLVKRHVFDEVGKPYFQSVARDQATLKPIAGTVWGGQDLDFYIRAQDAGFKITWLGKPITQYRVTEMGIPQTNDGFHKVKELDIVA